MNVVTNIEKWGNAHRPGWLDIFRIILGVFITFKGLFFITHMNELELTTSGINVYFAGVVLSHYIVFAHILGGPFIIFGLFTRIVSVVQLPILIGAIVFVNLPRGILSVANMELWVSAVVLAGLLVFIIFGAGRFSLDEKRRKEMELTNS